MKTILAFSLDEVQDILVNHILETNPVPKDNCYLEIRDVNGDTDFTIDSIAIAYEA